MPLGWLDLQVLVAAVDEETQEMQVTLAGLAVPVMLERQRHTIAFL
jgi:hypothetical protein